MSTTRLLLVHARSPLHVGTGQSTSAVDLPIARDRATAIPLVPGSSLKGPLKARARDAFPKDYERIFGPETERASDHAGNLVFTDARLLLMPVRSVAGTFAWVTSPFLLAAAARDAALARVSLPPGPSVAGPGACHAPDGTVLVASAERKLVILEDLDLVRAAVTPEIDRLAQALGGLVFPNDPTWQGLLRQRLCVVHDDVMSFLVQYATEVVTRVSIDAQTGTAKSGQLWTEENLPAETVLVALAEQVPAGRFDGPRTPVFDVLTALVATPVQLGGKATVGRGRCQLVLHGGA